MSNLTLLFQTWGELPNPPNIRLENSRHESVGTIYLKSLDYSTLAILEINKSEKYYFYTNGVGIFFTYFIKEDPAAELNQTQNHQ